MALEELIVAWSKERPIWQREVMRRVAAGDLLSDGDYNRLTEDILSEKQFADSEFELEQFQQTAADDLPVHILSIGKLEHVNALETKQPLMFEPLGLTIVYGDNASGKSGYARLLKRIARARNQEDVLTDVFRDNSQSRPTAALAVKIGETELSLSWPESSRPEFKRMLFYDAACGTAYVATESDFPYRPSALFVMDGLIEACVAVRKRIDVKLAQNGAAINEIPNIPAEIQDTDAGRFLASLSGGTQVEALDAFIARLETSTETIDELRSQEARLRSADTSKERQLLGRQSEKLLAVREHLDRLNTALGIQTLSTLQQHLDEFKALEKAAALLPRSFDSEPLHGVGSSPWKALWEAAKRFSEEHAYPSQPFPGVTDEHRCVLCQQVLDEKARDRFARFKAFVTNDTQVRLQEARRVYEYDIKSLAELVVLPEVVTNNLTDLEGTHRDTVAEIREVLAELETVRGKAHTALVTAGELPRAGYELVTIIIQLLEASNAAKSAAEELTKPECAQKQLAALVTKWMELELLEQIGKSRPAIIKEIARLKEREALEVAKSAAATTGITKKILELSEESITEIVRDTFTRETDRLCLERVTISRTRADKGTLLHQPKLVGARQQVTLQRVFSEGERNALGLAAFFTEAKLDRSHSALILDDPVNSLDHTRRRLVAARLAALAGNRQVIVFTHDVAFVADLKCEANGKGVPIAERSVTRSRAAERKPGVCSSTHPWKAKDVAERFDELRRDLVRVRNESSNWSQKEYEDAVAVWSGNLSETWERIFSQEVVGPILVEGGVEVRPMMVKILTRFTEKDRAEFDASYSRVSQWTKRHDKSAIVNYVAPDVTVLEKELEQVYTWFKRVKGYKA